MSSKTLSLIFVASAGILWGCISIFIRGLTACGLSSFDISALRVFISVILMLAALLIFRRDLLKISLKDIWIFIGSGIISLTLFTACYFRTVVETDAGVAAALLYTSPAFIMILSAILFKERITGRKIISIIMTIAGCFLISGMIGSGTKIAPMSLALGICSGLFYAMYSIFCKYAKKYNPITVIFYTFVFASLGFLPFSDPVKIVRALASAPGAVYYALGIAVICSLLPYLLYTKGLKNLDASVAGVVVAVEPLVAALVGILFYGESTMPAKLAGIGLILVSIIAVK